MSDKIREALIIGENAVETLHTLRNLSKGGASTSTILEVVAAIGNEPTFEWMVKMNAAIAELDQQEGKADASKLSVARDWIEKAPHGDNCFLHDDGGEFDTCRCGKDSLLAYIDSDSDDAPPLTMSQFATRADLDAAGAAHEIWAAAQLLPNEGIEDGVDRIAGILTARAERDALEVTRLRAALQKYGRHGTTEKVCAFMKHSDYKCDCGLDAAMAAHEGEQQ